MISSAMGIWNYWIVFILMMIGLFLVIGRKNFLKKIVGLTIFQTSVFLLYITFGKITGATPPILKEALDTVYSNPLPHVLILTAIVVGVAATKACLSFFAPIATKATEAREEISKKTKRLNASPVVTRPIKPAIAKSHKLYTFEIEDSPMS